ncbi:hypothetical protein VTO42DRAFT_742 [Malbranchea cinnamomea]
MCFRFLTSDTVSLRADGSDRLFRIHRGLLAMKCKPISVALERKEFRESEGVYTFKEVSEGTVMRFIEWAYTGEYPAVIDDDEPVELGSPEKPAESAKEVSDDEHNPDTEEAAKRSARTASQNHPLLTHIRLYIFGHIFLIQKLQNQAFDKVTACFTDMDRPDTLDKQLAVISALRIAFLKLPAQDRLLDWLAQYAAYCLGELRQQATFHNLLETSSLFGSRLILWLSPASSPPWRLDHPEPDYPHYVPEPIPEEAEPGWY